ncbi:MAG: hypothetical protein ACR2KL_00100 [Nocardioidaceae bacterium]
MSRGTARLRRAVARSVLAQILLFIVVVLVVLLAGEYLGLFPA